jgi:hypothetical protein
MLGRIYFQCFEKHIQKTTSIQCIISDKLFMKTRSLFYIFFKNYLRFINKSLV